MVHSRLYFPFGMAYFQGLCLTSRGYTYPLVNDENSDGTSPFSVGNTSSKGTFSIAMSVFPRGFIVSPEVQADYFLNDSSVNKLFPSGSILLMVGLTSQAYGKMKRRRKVTGNPK